MNLRETLVRYSLFFVKSSRRYRALKPFIKSSWYETDLNQYLASFIKSSLNINDKKSLQQNFCLRMSSDICGDSLHLPKPYRDTRYTLALYKYDELLVEERKIVVRQIQGNPGKGETLRLFKWERMLLTILTDWAKKSGFSQIRVIEAKDQNWYRIHRAKQMFMHYDVTARRSGFAFNQSIGQYIKILT